ncbi:hypothetical protein LWI28_006684 [Acer negundo]|uniref:Reverse transcriptase domain-containing protein n=1 Tax=Acer negundo TaxID=4023 RepID=A0AAD5ICQ1_ACENE|nr:hypothetical protein LWI28_006684 [Acer negundo]
MDAASTPRPDGFSGSFYQRCWDVVGSDMVLAVQDFFITRVIFPGLNSSFIVLLPKLRDSISVDQFRPIVLSNFLFKISSKILTDRLARVAAGIISPQQFDFIRDRVLRTFGFSSVFLDWIDSILRLSRLSVLFNGVLEGYFCCSRGVRQGDSLFPLLFDIVEDFLSRLLTRLVGSSQILPISSPRGFLAPTHLLYADDFLIFCKGTQKNLKHIIGAFRDYGDISGQLVNYGRSSIYFGSFVSLFRISSLQSLVGIQIGQLPFYYLGVTLFRGKPQKAVLRPIADKILSKFAKWKGKSLYLAGHATLIRLVITGSFVHSFMIYKWPSSLLSLINRKLRNFLWTGSYEETKLVRVAWDHCCRPYSQGSFGLKDLRLLNDSLLWKFTWKFITSYGFAFSFLRERYLRHLQKPYGGICGVSSESTDHLFLHCPLAVALWEAIFSTFQLRVSTKTWQSFFLQAMSISFSEQVRILWKATIHAMIWKVWTTCNQWIFEGKSVDFRSIISLVWCIVSEANRLDIGCMRNCMDNLLILRRFGLQGRPSKTLAIKSVIWSPSASGLIKVNTDGVVMGFPGFGGCGGIFRNCRAFVKGYFAIPLGQVFAFEAELLAASLAINFAWKYGWYRL